MELGLVLKKTFNDKTLAANNKQIKWLALFYVEHFF